MKTMIEHVALRVTDLERSIDFYRKVMGFEPVSRRMIGNGAIEQVVFRVGEDVLVLFYSHHLIFFDITDQIPCYALPLGTLVDFLQLPE